MKKEKYDRWFPQKRELDEEGRMPLFKQREVWWCQIGVNIGFELFGKGENLTRPVLVVRKYSKSSFFGLPLSTTKPKIPALHIPTNAGGKKGIVRLDQGRVLDARRLQRRLCIISHTEYEEIVSKFIKSFEKN